MQPHKLVVKNMVCDRCVFTVQDILNKLEVPYHHVTFGEIELADEIASDRFDELGTTLKQVGLELIDSRNASLVEKIKTITLKKARNEVSDEEQKQKLSFYLSSQLHHEYTYISSLFSSIEGRTIENFFIQQRIEKAKELIIYNEMNLSEIAFKLDYSSVAHLSAQFKKMTGLTPKHFKEVGSAMRKSLDKV